MEQLPSPNNSAKPTSSTPSAVSEKQSERLVDAIVTRLDLLLGGGNTPEALEAIINAVSDLWPDMTTEDFADAMKHGLRSVDVSYKLTIPTIAKFIRAFDASPDRWKAFEQRFQRQYGRKPNSGDPLAIVPSAYRIAKWN